MTPPNFNVDLTNLSTTTQDISVTAPAGSDGRYTLSIGNSLDVYTTVPITVTDGTPDFLITAAPSEVRVANNVLSSNVQFTVTSINGFSGAVKITWVGDGGASPSPADNDFTGTVTPTTPFKFVRKMYRYSTDIADIPLTFNATDIPFTKTRSATVTIKLP